MEKQDLQAKDLLKVAAVEPELYCKITPMYKCYYIEQINV